ncbi:CCA tRNA nucleotidyltransferase, mitochondrial [Dissophora ornata]|nr:CCA tRNA nucleotidyltransferase, mitochondrial [Dissophora ornata]
MKLRRVEKFGSALQEDGFATRYFMMAWVGLHLLVWICYDFANLVSAYMEARGQGKKTIFRITANHERSKHLETSTMNVMGMSIDFANLRSEVFDASNRVLNESIFGSPYEDAYHRDFTINALFYNIHTDSVEDYTGKGLDDLRDGWIRTPLAAYDTFWQDPLRILRCIRFATRFNFQIAADAKQAMLDPKIKEKLQTKISVERIGREFMMLVDNAAGRSVAMRLLQENMLYDVVFPVPVKSVLVKGVSAVNGERHDTEDAFKLAWIVEWLLQINSITERSSKDDADVAVFLREKDPARELLLEQTHGVPMTSHLYPLIRSAPPSSVPFNVPCKEDANPKEVAARNLIYAAMLHPYRDMTATINGDVIPAATCIYKYSLKGRKSDVDAVKRLLENIEGANGAVNSISLEVPMDDELRKKEMVEIGMFIRNIAAVDAVNKKWPCSLLLALGVELLPKFEQLNQGVLDEEAKAMITKYNLFLSRARYYEIDHCFSWNYIVDVGIENLIC